MSKSVNRLLLTAAMAMAIFIASAAQAVPPKPGSFDPETMTFYSTGEPVPLILDHPAELNPNGQRGVYRYPVILMDTSDMPALFPASDFTDQIYSDGTYPTGSMRDYYEEISYGAFLLEGEVSGWHRADNPMTYYTNNEYGQGATGREFIVESVMKASQAGMDFSTYDNDGDGEVEGVIIIHSGRDAATTGNRNMFWSHMSRVTPFEVNGVTVSTYCINPELEGTTTMAPIGTVCHEFGHVLGLPDLYDTAGSGNPIGNWCLMSSGSYLNSGDGPAHMSVYCRMLLQWVTPTLITAPATGINIPWIQNHANGALKIQINDDPLEYFLLENRGRQVPGIQFDAFNDRWDTGIVVYHCDDNNRGSNSSTADHWRVIILNPDPVLTNLRDAAYCLEDDQTLITPETEPSSDGWYLPSNIWFSNISNSGENMTFDLKLNPTLVYNSMQLTPLGNNQYDLVVNLRNAAQDANSVQATLTCPSTSVTILDGSASYPNIARNGTGANTAQPFRFQVNPAGPRGEIAAFRLTATAAPDYVSTALEFPVILNPSEVLFIDDDQDNKYRPGAQDPFITEALAAIPGLTFDTWENVDWSGPPEYGNLALYNIIIWNPYNGYQKVLDDAEEALISQFLDDGGRILINAQEYLYQRFPYQEGADVKDIPVGSFARDYLHITQVEHDEYYYNINPVAGEPLAAGISGTVRLTDNFSSGNCGWWPDDMALEPSAAGIFTQGAREGSMVCPYEEGSDADDIPNGPVALRFPGPGYASFYKVVFTAFQLEGMPLAQRTQFLSNVIEWFRIEEATPTPGPTTTPPPTSPTPTPTQSASTPTPVPTEEPVELGVRLEMPSNTFHPGDDVYLLAYLDNDGTTAIYNLVVLLDIGTDEFWFYPTWVHYPPDIAYKTVTLAPGTTEEVCIPSFEWPTIAGAASGFYFHGALLNAALTSIQGNLDSWQFGWAP